MLAWKPPPVVVLCWPVTVIAGVRTDAGVLLAADRAAVNPGRLIAPGVYAPQDERTKLVLAPGGVALALAGTVGTGDPLDGEAADLLTAARAVVAEVVDGGVAALAVRRLFERAAPAIRRYAEPLGAPTVLPPFERPVRAVALVSGPEPGGPRLYAVGLTTDGDCVVADIDGPGTAYGPTDVVTDLEQAVLDAAGQPLEGAVRRVGAAITDVSCRHPNLVTLDWDRVVVGPQGAGPLEEHRHPRRVVVPRH